jgi:acetylornithine deacetylase/succinyl-diaminopimelate desuccinylase-like protein
MTGQPGFESRRRLLQGAAAAAALAPFSALAAAGDMDAVRKAVEGDHDANLKRLRDWIALPAIAAENRNVEDGCRQMMELAKEAGFTNVQRVATDGIPGVFGVMDNGASHWLGLYFMYDVKQFDPNEWTSPPLEGRLVDRPGLGKVLIGRGATNQKGPESAMLAALHGLRAAGKKPPVNLVLVCEGEEEIGSPHFTQVVRRPDILAALKPCKGVIIPSSWQDPSDGSVVVNLGAKGIVELELVASGEAWGRGPGHDIHSSFKAVVDSPAWRLVEALQTLVSADGNTPAIDGWFEKVRPLSAREKQLIAESAASRSSENERRALAVKTWIGNESWGQTLERLASQPTVNIEGLVAGYTGPGGKTILPGRAAAKIDMRLVPNQTRDDCVAKLKAHLVKRGFSDVAVNVTGGYDPTETAEDSPLIKAELATYKKAGVQTTIYPRLAGSWPGYVFTSAPVSLPAGQFGLGSGSGAHAPDEWMLIESANPKVLGYDGATLSFVEFLYQIAGMA